MHRFFKMLLVSATSLLAPAVASATTPVCSGTTCSISESSYESWRLYALENSAAEVRLDPWYGHGHQSFLVAPYVNAGMARIKYLETETGVELADVSLGAGLPRNIIITAEGDLFLILRNGPDDFLVKVDLPTALVVWSEPLAGMGGGSVCILQSPNSGHIYAAVSPAIGLPALLEIDSGTGAILRTTAYYHPSFGPFQCLGLADGSMMFSNGTRIFHVDAAGDASLINSADGTAYYELELGKLKRAYRMATYGDQKNIYIYAKGSYAGQLGLPDPSTPFPYGIAVVTATSPESVRLHSISRIDDGTPLNASVDAEDETTSILESMLARTNFTMDAQGHYYAMTSHDPGPPEAVGYIHSNGPDMNPADYIFNRLYLPDCGDLVNGCGPRQIAMDHRGTAWVLVAARLAYRPFDASLNTTQAEMPVPSPYGGVVVGDDLTGYITETVTHRDTGIALRTYDLLDPNITVLDFTTDIQDMPVDDHLEVDYRIGTSSFDLNSRSWQPLGTISAADGLGSVVRTFPPAVQTRYIQIRVRFAHRAADRKNNVTPLTTRFELRYEAPCAAIPETCDNADNNCNGVIDELALGCSASEMCVAGACIKR